MTLGARIDALTKDLLGIASANAPDLNEAHFRAHIALMRILRRDPDLERFDQIAGALRRELDLLDAGRRARSSRPAPRLQRRR
jgi:hypothetical protein